MSTSGKKRGRSQRVAPLDLPPGRWARVVVCLQRGDVIARLAACLATMLAMWGLARGWVPPFDFHVGDVPARDLTAMVDFREPDELATQKARDLAASQTPVVYQNDNKAIGLWLEALKNGAATITKAPSFRELNRETWQAFQPPPGGEPLAEATQEKQFDEFRAALNGETGLAAFDKALDTAFEPFARHGLLEKLPPDHGEGNQKEISVYELGRPRELFRVGVSDVLLDGLQKRLKENLSPPLAERVLDWLKHRPRNTLVLDPQATQVARLAAAEAVEPRFIVYQRKQVLAAAGQPLGETSLRLLEREYEVYSADRGWAAKASRSVGIFGLLVALFALCGYYVYRRQRRLIDEWSRLATLLGWVALSVALVRWAAPDPWRAELIPVLLFGVTFAIAYPRDVALVLSIALSLVASITCGHGLGEFLILAGVVTSAIVQLDCIRSRSKLLLVGGISGLVAFAATLGVGLLDEQPWDWSLWTYAARNGLWTLAAGFLLTGLLPLIEKLFGVLTEISLLEWGDVSHPLLQELVRRAPGTYNHSINVASIAEAAAEAIGANGLLVRVGAYFHDIGKMLKPAYFVENQVPGANRHDTLMPAMSTLIIIAHIKDGADLARQHNLPQAIIDFIEQHHGTTLVEYFFKRASAQSEADPNGADVPESSYRYPGPKPQTLEAAVLMLADAAESASRALVEPTPARLESLVEEIAQKKLADGQFDECALTLSQLRQIEDSLIKSLSAVYHGRIKYPTQQTA